MTLLFVLALCGLHAQVASALVTFYVDPTYIGGSNDGSATHPWLVLGNAATKPEWVAINTALATDDVTVYFSARTVPEDLPEVQTAEIRVFRTDTGAHRLTLNGMAKWNTCDTSGAWIDYEGLSKFKVVKASGALGIGWGDVEGRENYITLTGFEVTGVAARIIFGGSHLVVEHINVHDITTTGATMQTHLCTSPAPACIPKPDMDDVVIQDNSITNGYGEGIYISCNYQPSIAIACPNYLTGPTHFLIQRNVITNPAANGGQGDGIDLKVGMRNSTIRNNVIVNPKASAMGISYSGVYGSDPDGMIFENNLIVNAGGNGIGLGNSRGAIVRNNVLTDGHSIGIALIASEITSSQAVKIYNNTVYTIAGGNAINIAGADNTFIRNNILYTNVTTLYQAGAVTGTNSGTNILKASNYKSANWPVEINDLFITDPALVLNNPASGDMSLLATSPAIDAGVTIDACGALDFTDTSRPQGSAWDIGAYEAHP